ncbi:MAG: hypothetical protein QXI38_01220 [Conexivisphaerales archaeon]
MVGEPHGNILLHQRLNCVEKIFDKLVATVQERALSASVGTLDIIIDNKIFAKKAL